MSRTVRTTIACSILAIASIGAARAEAKVLYSTIPDSSPPTYSYVNNPLPSNIASDSGVPDYSASGWAVFDSFTLSQGASSIDLGVYNYILGSGFAGVNWSIWTSNKGAPGVEIGSGTANVGAGAALISYLPPAGSDQPGASLVTVDGVHLDQVLTAGVTYFLEFQIVFGSGSKGSSAFATAGLDKQTYLSDNNGAPFNNAQGNYYPQLAFYVQNAVAAPEPSTWVMLAIGFSGIGWAARRGFTRARPI